MTVPSLAKDHSTGLIEALEWSSYQIISGVFSVFYYFESVLVNTTSTTNQQTALFVANFDTGGVSAVSAN